MIIGIQRGLNNIKDYLESKGYKVVYTDSNSKHIDAYIYSSNKVDEILTSQNGLSNNTSIANRGVFMINASGKTMEYIESAVNNKCYSQLDLTIM